MNTYIRISHALAEPNNNIKAHHDAAIPYIVPYADYTR